MSATTDIHLDWNAGFKFDASNDILLATDAGFELQRIVRGLLTVPQVVDAQGQVVTPSNNLFEPTRGAGLSRDVEGQSDAASRADRETRILTYMAQEPVVDQTKPVTVTFANDPTTGSEFALVSFSTTSGADLTAGLV